MATTDGNYYVSSVDYVSDVPSEPLGSLNSITDTCTGFQSSKVLSGDLFTSFQGGGDGNNFIQAVLRHVTNTAIGYSFGSASYLFLDTLMPKCLRVLPDESLESVSCYNTTTIAAVLCVKQDGDISSLSTSLASCTPDPGAPQTGELCFEVVPSITGVSAIRDITCMALNLYGSIIDTTIQVVPASKNVPGLFCPVVAVDLQFTSIQCQAMQSLHVPVSEEISTSMNLTFNMGGIFVIDPTPVPGTDLHYMKWENYRDGGLSASDPFTLRAMAFGYPLRDLQLHFNRIFDPSSAQSLSDKVTWSVRCTPTPEPYIQADVAVPMIPFEAGDSGNYTFQILAGEEEISTNIQLIHPFRMTCDKVCVDDARIGLNTTITCTVTHHLISSPAVNFRNFEDMPLNITLHKLPNPDTDPLNPCEYSMTPGEPLLFSFSGDNADWDSLKKEVKLHIEIYSMQLWTGGEFYLEILPNYGDCMYQPLGPQFCDKPFDTFNKSCNLLETDERLVYLSFSTPEDFGHFKPGLNSQCGPNNRALYIPDHTNPNGTQYYYRTCYDNVDGENPGETCTLDGGIWSDATDNLFGRIIEDPEFASFGQYSLAKLFRAVSCNSYFQRTDSYLQNEFFLPQLLHAKFLADGGVIRMMKFAISLFEEASDPGFYPVGILCRYPRGFVYDLYSDPAVAHCLYLPINLEEGRTQEIIVGAHGNEPVDIFCQPLPLGSYINSSYRVPPGSPTFRYSVPYPEESDVEEFRCAQVNYTGENALGLSNDHLDWRYLAFTSEALDMIVEDEVTSDDVFCSVDPNTRLTQPCYGQDVTLKCCTIGNPFDTCVWHKYLGYGETIDLENGTDGYMWNIVPDQDPQCDDTRKCSYLTISNLTEGEDDGYYWCRCFNGLEYYEEVDLQLRESKAIPINGRQSVIVGEAEFEYRFNCALGQTPAVRAIIIMKGPPVTVVVKCSEGDEPKVEVPVTQVREAGSDLISALIERPTSDTQCVFEASNSYADEPVRFNTDFHTQRLSTSPRIYKSIFQGSDKIEVCCDVCGINIEANHLKIQCVNMASGDEMIMNETEAFSYSTMRLQASYCVEPGFPTIESFECSCTLWEKSSSITIYGSGMIVTEPETTQEFGVGTTTPERVTLAPTEPPTTVEPTTTTTTLGPRTSTATIKDKDLNILVAFLELEEYVKIGRILFIILHDIFKVIRLNLFADMPLWKATNIIVGTFERVAQIGR